MLKTGPAEAGFRFHCPYGYAEDTVYPYGQYCCCCLPNERKYECPENRGTVFRFSPGFDVLRRTHEKK